MTPTLSKAAPQFFAGDLVEVKSLDEIRATLDANGAYEDLPFMPEMAAFCGKRLKVFRRAEKTCVEGHGLRQMSGTVLLEEARCKGQEHDGCQRNCLIFWKEAWLKPVADAKAAQVHTLIRTVSAQDLAPVKTPDGFYHCQSTALARATGHLAKWNLAPLVREVRHGELTVIGFLDILKRTLINRVRGLMGLPELGQLVGSAVKGPKGDLGLQAGEWVEIRAPEEIVTTLDPTGKNQGLSFEPDMMPYVGKRFEVDFSVRKIILEESGRMVKLSNTVALKDVTCRGFCVKNCPRANTLYWREAWLKRVEEQRQHSAA